MVERLRSSADLQTGGALIASVSVLSDLYEQRSFARAWTDPKAVQQLIEAIDESRTDGLDPDDYHQADIEQLRARIDAAKTDPELLADFDVILTDALIRLGYHLLFGKVDPEALYSNWNLAREIDDRDPVVAIGEIIRSGEIKQAIAERRPRYPAYERFKAALARYRDIQAKGGWRPVPEGTTLKKGIDDERVLSLRRRLMATGDLADDIPSTTSFDEDLEVAVKRFQVRNHLNADGAVGKNTIVAMNVPVEQRIDQIRVNLERARWVLHDLPGTFILVDIAGFGLRFFRDEQPVWSTRVQVGKPYRKTPVFKADIKYLVLNPTWTVPPGILRNDILPAIKRDVGYLATKRLRVVDHSGKAVDPKSIDWSRYPGQSFPYQLVQTPGPHNALGRVKFILPNPHFVFLHDTPSQSFFEKTERAFSSGCIRVEKPLELAELLLNDEEEWNRERILEALDTGQTRTVFLPEPTSVLILYWTIAVAEENQILFKKDLYGRDAAVLKALEGDFQFRKRPVAGRPQL